MPIVDTVQHQHVQMDVEVQRAAEALDQGDDAGPCAVGGFQARAPRCAKSVWMARVITARQRLSACGRLAKSMRSGQGKLSTHWRTGTGGIT